MVWYRVERGKAEDMMESLRSIQEKERGVVSLCSGVVLRSLRCVVVVDEEGEGQVERFKRAGLRELLYA